MPPHFKPVALAALVFAAPTAAPIDDLLSADRAFSAASARTDLISGLSAMFTADVAMPAPPGKMFQGKAAAVEALKANPDNSKSSIEWTPIRGGISSDGLHGFTFGYMTLHKPDGTTAPLKYLAYWVKGTDGWHVAAYKRGLRAEGTVSLELLPPALPPATAPPITDPATIERHRQSLDQAERAFSDESQRIGLGAAFVKYGSADAMNLGGPTSSAFVIGSEAIGQLVSGRNLGNPSPVNWAPDRVIVSSSGDLGVTIGTIHRNDKSASFPFFTIWRRATPNDPWRYIAE